MQTAIPCSLIRGGTSKGLYLEAKDLPTDSEQRDQVLLGLMGSPDTRQIDGLGGAHPLTSKVAIVQPSSHPEADVDYLFIQVAVDKAEVSDSQNCGNLLAGVGPFAIEQGLVKAQDELTSVRIHMLNTGSIAVAQVQTPGGQVSYRGDAVIDGVPGSAAPILLNFVDIAGASCGALLPTGNSIDEIEGVPVTCIDNGMPVVLINAAKLGKSGYETPSKLEADPVLKEKIERIRLQAGKIMNLGDVTKKTVPKISLVAPAQNGGVICTRTFIPHRVHEAIGVLGAVSVATACVLPGSVAQQITGKNAAAGSELLQIEHPTGFFDVEIEAEQHDGVFTVKRTALLRTARLLMRGNAFIPLEWELQR